MIYKMIDLLCVFRSHFEVFLTLESVISPQVSVNFGKKSVGGSIRSQLSLPGPGLYLN